MVGQSGGIDTNCTIVMQQMGRVAVVTQDPSSSPVGPKDARGMRRKAAVEEEDDDGGRRRRERERRGEDAWFRPADDERELQAWRPRLQIRFDVRYSTRLGRYNISDYNREFKIFIGNNLEAVGEDLNLMGVERVVEVEEVKMLAQASSPAARGTTAPSLRPTRRPQKPIGNTIDEVEINSKSFMVGATAGVVVFCAVAIATVMYFRWRRRADKEEAAGRFLRDRRDADAAARVGATTAGRGDGPSSLLGDDDDDDEQPQQHLMSSQIQDAGEPRIGKEEEDERLRAFAGPKLILSTHHPVRQQQQRQEEIGNNSGNGPPWVHSSSSLPDGPLGCEGSDVAVVVGTTEAIDITDSTNSKFYANLVSVPFQDDGLDTGMPVDIRPHPIMQMHRQQHSGASQGGEGGGRGGGGGGGRQAALVHEQMFINDASFSSSTSDDEGDGNVGLLPALRHQEDIEYDYYDDDGPDLLDGLTDEFDSYKNQDLETLRNAIERSVDGVDGMVSLAMAHAYTSNPTVYGLLEWFGGEQDDGRIEASCLCDAYDWLKINEMSSSDLV
jgi:hypothetical protein